MLEGFGGGAQIEADDGVGAAFKEHLDEAAADEAGGSGDEGAAAGDGCEAGGGRGWDWEQRLHRISKQGKYTSTQVVKRG